MTNHATNLLTAADGMQLFTQQWQPAGPTKGGVLIVHGISEHSSRYAHVAAHLAEHGYATYSYDQRGHGRSPGLRAYVERFDNYLSDLDCYVTQVRLSVGNQPLFLLGHSMGGAVAALYAITRQPAFNGLILSSAALQIPATVSPLLVRVAGLISAISPKLPTTKLEINNLARDLAVVQRYQADPLCYQGATRARTGAEILNAMQRIQAEADKLTLPLLIFHGTADRITDPAGSQLVYERAQSADKTLTWYPDSYHETFNDLDQGRVLVDLTTWLDRVIRN